jgi:dolichyl-phosphate beta-glucosyltransferase
MRGFHLYLSILGLRSIRDTQCFKLFSRSTVVLLFPLMHAERWIFDCEILLLAEMANIPIGEVFIQWHEVDGSKVDLIKDSIGMAVDLLMIRLNYALGRWTKPKKVQTNGEKKSNGILHSKEKTQ